MSKAIMWIVIAAIIIGGVWYFWSNSQSAPASIGAGQQQTQNAGSAGGATATNDTSNAALNADLNAIDTQAQSANSASASANSFTDTPVQQTQ